MYNAKNTESMGYNNNNNNNNNSLFQTFVDIHNSNIIIKNTYIQSINKYITDKKIIIKIVLISTIV